MNYSELWEVVDAGKKKAQEARDADHWDYALGVGDSTIDLISALTRLGIERPQPKKVCGECRWSESTEIFCRYPVEKKGPIALGWTRFTVGKNYNATNCECFEPKE